MEVLEFIGWFFSASWDFFTEVKVPGFDFSFGALFVGLFLACLGLRFLGMMLGIGVPTGSAIAIARHNKDSQKGGKTK